MLALQSGYRKLLEVLVVMARGVQLAGNKNVEFV